MNINAVKRGKGRPKGATSFVEITLQELNEKFKPQETIPVGRIFLEKQAKVQSQPAPSDAPKVEMKLED